MTRDSGTDMLIGAIVFCGAVLAAGDREPAFEEYDSDYTEDYDSSGELVDTIEEYEEFFTSNETGDRARQMCSQYSDLSSHFIPPFCTSSRKIVMNRWLESVEARLLSAGVIIPFMIGGSRAGEKHFPHLASISWRNTHICGASLISKKHILTAAHCFEDLLKREAWMEKNKSIWVFPGEELNKYQVKFGVNDLNSTYRVQNLPLRTVYIHPAFTPALLLNDIAVAQLDGEVQFSDVVRPACLNTEAGNNTSRATISGWGVTDTGLKSQSSQHMMHLSVDFTDPEDCINKYQLFHKNVTRRHKEKLICTKSLRDNHNACKYMEWCLTVPRSSPDSNTGTSPRSAKGLTSSSHECPTTCPG